MSDATYEEVTSYALTRLKDRRVPGSPRWPAPCHVKTVAPCQLARLIQQSCHIDRRDSYAKYASPPLSLSLSSSSLSFFLLISSPCGSIGNLDFSLPSNPSPWCHKSTPPYMTRLRQNLMCKQDPWCDWESHHMV
jgi:hypothetical protein